MARGSCICHSSINVRISCRTRVKYSQKLGTCLLRKCEIINKRFLELTSNTISRLFCKHIIVKPTFIIWCNYVARFTTTVVLLSHPFAFWCEAGRAVFSKNCRSSVNVQFRAERNADSRVTTAWWLDICDMNCLRGRAVFSPSWKRLRRTRLEQNRCNYIYSALLDAFTFVRFDPSHTP